MKKRRHIYALATSLILGSFVATTLSACGTSENYDNAKIVVTGNKNGKVGDKIKLEAQVFNGPNNAQIVWTSLDVAIATVDANGEVTLLNQGTALIQASLKDNSAIKSSVISISCYGENEATKELRVVSLPTTTRYKVGSKLSFEGLSISGFDCYDGIADNLSGQAFKNDELTFSVKEGTTLETEGKMTITVSKTDYKSVSFEISVEKVVVVRALKVSSFPTKSRYLLKSGETTRFDSTGLKVSLITYEDGEFKSSKLLENKDLELSIKSGTQLTKEGNYSIEVTYKQDKTVLSDTFSIAVFTENLSIYNLIKGMQDSNNYQFEILNNVGTNNDATGFHYLRTYTKDYYEETEYQNVINSEKGTIEFSKDKIKNQSGYLGYQSPTGEKSIIGYRYNSLGSVEGTNIITKNSSNWWDKASSLTSLPTIFNLKDLPTETKNGQFLATVIDHEDNDTTGDATIAKYPLIQEFLQFCGWSTNLITIMSRFEVKIENDFDLSMKAYFGSYGTTELKVTGYGNCSIQAVEEALAEGTIVPDTSIDAGVSEVAEKLRGDYAVRYGYGDSGVDTTTPLTTFHKDYYYDSSANLGYAKISGKVYEFERTQDKNTKEYKFELTSEKPVSQDITEVSKYVETLKDSGAVIYPKDGLKEIIGVKDSAGNLSANTLNTFAKYSAFSSTSEVCYQSFDDGTKKAYENYLLGGEALENGRIWFLTHYVDSLTNPNEQEIELVETWDVNLTTGSGYVIPLGGFSKEEATIDWVEKGIAQYEASGQLK